MRLRNNKNADTELNQCSRYLESKEQIQEVLTGYSKINIEIGMGKGQFLTQMARLHKDQLFIGIEVCKSVLALAIKKLNRYESAEQVTLPNLYVTSLDAVTLTSYFEAHQIDIIYLNFSDPWPKARHEKRRLTYSTFLDTYVTILKKDGILQFKTDNRKLFEYSLLSLNQYGFCFEQIYLDVHDTEIANVMTEYEIRFSKLGPIYMLVGKFLT